MSGRTKCVLCCSQLQHIYAQKNYPITYCPKNSPDSEDICQDLNYGSCIHCGSVQLMTLIDPSILYQDSHNITYDTPTWKTHHQKFADFVLANCPNTDILEIGGSSGILAKNILDNQTCTYSILDLCEPLTRDLRVNYIIANCEQYSYHPNVTVVMSHLFEHLYEPRLFIKNLACNNVNNVCISIPNMRALLQNNSPAVVHTEHTYYLEDSDAELLFKSYGYTLQTQFNYKEHSHFMYFKRTDNTQLDVQWPANTERANKILATFNYRDTHFGQIVVKPNSFIVPGGHYGQIMYRYMQNTREHIIGFLDNDPSKQGKRVYGTHSTVFPFSYIQKYSTDELVHIYLHAGPYSHEIKRQIQDNCPNTVIYEL